MQLRMVVHLPGVALVTGETALGRGFVANLNFDEWHELDGKFPYAESDYTKARPAFWVADVEVSDDAEDEEVFGLLEDLSDHGHRSFLLEPRVPWLPSPVLSSRYIRGPGALTRRLIGPAEAEWIVYGSPVTVEYDEAALDDVAREIEWSESVDLDSAQAAVRAAVATLERTARPDSWWGNPYGRSINDFVHCIAACDRLLTGNEDSNETLTRRFGRRLAVISSESFANVAANAAYWSDTYRLRSDLIHGRIGSKDLAEGDEERLMDGRKALRALIHTAATLGPELRHKRLSMLLDEAVKDEQAYAALLQRLAGGSP